MHNQILYGLAQLWSNLAFTLFLCRLTDGRMLRSLCCACGRLCSIRCVVPAGRFFFSSLVRQKREIKPYFESSYKVWQVWAPDLCLSVKPCSLARLNHLASKSIDRCLWPDLGLRLSTVGKSAGALIYLSIKFVG